MRKPKNLQFTLFCQWSEHRFSKELQETSKILDKHPEFIAWVADDLSADIKGVGNGAGGMSAEQVLRAAILKQQDGWSYQLLEYQCEDSIDTRSFLRLDYQESYSRSCLQRNIALINPGTWVKINNALVKYAAAAGGEKGRTIRMDATVIESNIHAPTDSTLFYDCLRVTDRELKKIRQKTRIAYYPPLTTKEAKTKLLKVQYAKNRQERKKPYRVLINAAKGLLAMLPRIIERFQGNNKIDLKWIKRIVECLPIIISQTERRVIKGENVASNEKIVSIFELHTDIVKKGKRETEYGHKIFLAAGKSGLISDCQLVQGNPADSEYFIDLIKRQRELYGRVPRQTSADGGFASEDNVYEAKDLGVRDVCFSKPCGVSIEEMVKSRWVFQKLRKFRAGIEGVISVLKRAFGMERVTWKGCRGFASYVHSGVVAYNLTILARLKIA